VNNRILTQGHFDGYCLQYSIFNSYKTLIKPEQIARKFVEAHSRKWTKIISISPSLQNFSSGKGSDFGVDTNKVDIKLTRMFVTSCFDVLTEITKQSITITEETIFSLKDFDFKNSVVIVALKNDVVLEHGKLGNHWIAIVGKDEENERFLIACSYTLHQHGFQEKADNVTGRFYNNTLSFSTLRKKNIYENSIHGIRIKSA
jgi:hypothetical protein